MKGLNGWQRIGIVASIVWMIGGTHWLRESDANARGTYANSSLSLCNMRVRAGDKSAADCLAEYQINWKLEVIDHQAEIDAGAFGLALIARARLAVRLGSCRAWSMGSRWLRASSLTPAPQGDEPSRRCFLMREVRRNTDH
jgi:hypothetical protein